MAQSVIGILLFDEVDELDFAGPWEVFTQAGFLREDLRVCTIAERAGPIACAKGLRVLPHHSFADAPEINVLLVPGGRGTRRQESNPAVIDWIRTVGERCRWVTSVCTGAVLLQRAGLTRGRRITTHWALIPVLRKRAPDTEIVEGVRYVHDGNLVTAAGVSAGIDMALWLTGQLTDVAHARKVQRIIEYSPVPPYAEDA
jgi:transcriptional regulator GlxA family with amidase domain